ncbi:MAG: arginase family protein, partial [bacterium]|nr:arginase family protein [bacterium]
MLKIIKAGTSAGSFNQGSELAPDAILENGLEKALHTNKIGFEIIGEIEHQTSATARNDIHYLTKINKQIYNFATQNIKSSDRLLTIGGDHSISIGSMFATKALEPKAQILYIDAHPDCNDFTNSPTGNIHGMSLSTVLGDSLYKKFNLAKYSYNEVVILAAKDIDDFERKYITKNKIKMFEMNDIIEHGIGEVLIKTLDYLGNNPLHVNLDIDSIDAMFSPATGIANQVGLTYREIKYVCEKLASNNIKSIDLVEVNPKLDPDNKTLNLAIELVITLLDGRWSSYD